MQGREALPVSQRNVVTRCQPILDARHVALKCAVVEFLPTFAIHADSVSEHTTTHRHEREHEVRINAAIARGQAVILDSPEIRSVTRSAMESRDVRARTRPRCG